VKSGGKDGGTTNLSNNLKRNHAENKEVKLTFEESNSNENAHNPDEANNSVNPYFTIFACGLRLFYHICLLLLFIFRNN